MLLSKKQLTAVAIAAIFTSLAPNVHGHGHLASPRSRNYVAHQDGVWWPADGLTPYPENCPHCKFVLPSYLAICHFIEEGVRLLPLNDTNIHTN
jgi:hypothetical protein